jgi:hypothetical protein
MRLQSTLVEAIKGLIEDVKITFPLDTYEAQKVLADALKLPEITRKIVTTIELKNMEDI